MWADGDDEGRTAPRLVLPEDLHSRSVPMLTPALGFLSVAKRGSARRGADQVEIVVGDRAHSG